MSGLLRLASMMPKPVSGAFAPTDIASLVVMLEAENDTQSYANNDKVGQATDLSGNGNHFTASGTARPTYKTSQVNGKATYRFAGTPEEMNGVNLSALTAGEAFLVFQVDNDPATSSTTGGLWQFGTGTRPLMPHSNGTWYDDFGSDSRKVTGNPTPDLSTQYRLYNVISTSSEFTCEFDTSAHYTTATNTVAFNSDAYIGADAGSSGHMTGDIAAIYIFSAKLSTDDRTSMQDYIDTMFALGY